MELKEIKLEEKIEKYLVSKGGYTIGDPTAYDTLKGYNPKSLIEFIKTTQAKKWNKLNEIKGPNTVDYFCNMVEKEIKEFGLLSTLRGKIKLFGMEFRLIYFKPETDINPDLIELYNHNICECVRQLHYSINNNNSLDITLFINGFPLVTMELKNQYCQQKMRLENHLL